MLRSVAATIITTTLSLLTACSVKDQNIKVPEETRFTKIILAQGLDEPMELAPLEDGRVLFIERKGKVKLFDPELRATKTIAQLNVHSEFEDGLLGLTLDPGFKGNGWVYFYYSPAGSEWVQHVSRFKLADDSLILSTEKVLLKIPVQRETCCHSAGSLTFGPDNNLYIAVGDNTSSKKSEGYTPIDERPGRGPYDAQKSSSNTHDFRGKVLRIHPEKNGTYTIPDGNLFPKDGSKGKPEIYTMGCRNPFRISVDSKTGWLFWGDVGPDVGKPHPKRGPESYDEFNLAKSPGNFGWPYFIADNKSYIDFDFQDSISGKPFDPLKPENDSPNNTGQRFLPPAQPALIYYPYGESKEFPAMGSGGRSAMAGPFYRSSDFNTQSKFPDYFDGKLFIYEWMREWIQTVSFDKEGKILKIEPFLPGLKWVHPIDMEFGKDGSLYILEYGTNWFTENDDAKLVKLEYAKGNRKPVANISADKVLGAIPLKVKFSPVGSIDYDGDSLQYEWEFGDSQKSTSSDKYPEFIFEKPGVYNVSLKVRDTKGKFGVSTLQIKAGNEPPNVKFEITEGNRSFYKDKILYNVTVSDKEDGKLNEGILEERVAVHIDYLPQQNDLALVETGLQQVASLAKNIEGKKLVEGSDCKACHSIDKKSVGPSFLDIAGRYGSQDKIDFLANKIITGGSGNWGHSSMSAHPQLNKEQTTKMVKYILSLGQSGSSSKSLPTKGIYEFKDHVGQGDEGIYILSAQYADNGANGIQSINKKDRIILRDRKLQTETFDFYKNMEKWAPDAGKLLVVNHRIDPAYFGFKDIDLNGVKMLTFKVMEVNKGCRIDVRLDKPEGPVWTSYYGDPNHKKLWDWYLSSVSVAPQSGKHDLYFVYDCDKIKNKETFIVDWIYFHFEDEKLSLW